MKTAFLFFPLLLSTEIAAQEIDYGAHFYTEHCATCHGYDGKGQGELSDLLTIEVPDLTVLSQKNDGEFPMLKVIQVIDGRSGMRAHDKPMPPYGTLFRQELAPPLGISGAVEPLIRGRVLSIAEYLESIQQ